MGNLFDAVRDCLLCADVEQKLTQTRATAVAFREGRMDMEPFGTPVDVRRPGRPLRPRLVPPARVPGRGTGTPEGRAIMLHAIAHIEFNAINLALDIVQRFSGMPDAFYADWLQVADEEVYHFVLVRTHLQTFGHDYGDFDAHNGLWEMAEKTADDVLERLALVPRVLEARGLDVTPGIMAKFRQAGDEEAVAILEVILRDEIGHVEAGTRWFRHVCRQRGLDAGHHFLGLLKAHFPAGLKGVLNVGARRQAGFTDHEMKRARQIMACR
ncbi:MAG: ferritin-like domain-containing protein [Mariprofundaceae bacterium]|nr:ferritin-like domain-containing protein [Mariprofundaceae bacterium]